MTKVQTHKTRVSLKHVLENLGTPSGRLAIENMFRDIERFIPERGEQDPIYLKPSSIPLPADRFEKQIATRLIVEVTPRSQAPQQLPSILARLLRSTANAKGEIDLGKVSQTLGEGAARFLRTVDAIDEHEPRGPVSDRQLLEYLSREERSALLEVMGVKSPDLPALNDLSKRAGKAFSGFKLLAVQHLFMSTTSLLDAFHQSGVEYADMSVLGKVYSTNYRAGALLEAKGAQVDPRSLKLGWGGVDFELTYRDALRDRIGRMVNTLPHPPEENPKPSVLLLDDGGEAIAMVNREFGEYAPYFIGVEQTRRGARLLRHLDLNMPVVNVAETWAKLQIEAPLIGHSVVLEIQRTLDSLASYGVDTGRTAVVSGYGAVGKAVADALRVRGFQVHVYDPDPKRREQAVKDGAIAHKDLTDALPFGKVLVGAVGERSLTWRDAELLPDGAVLFNAASSNDELQTQPMGYAKETVGEDGTLWSCFQGKNVALGMARAEAHADQVRVTEGGKEILIAHSGYVVNMTGEEDPIPSRFMQLTRGLLFLGAMVGQKASKPGLIGIPGPLQRALVHLVETDLARTGESLRHPAWEEGEKRTGVTAQTPSTPVINALAPVERAPVPTEHIADPRAIYGYLIADASSTSREHQVDALLGNQDGKLSVFEAALDRALYTVNRYFPNPLRAAMSEDQLPYMNDVVVTAAEGVWMPEDPVRQFEQAYGHWLNVLVEGGLKSTLGRAPSLDEKSGTLAEMYRTSSVIPGPWLAELRAEGGASVQLADKIQAALANNV